MSSISKDHGSADIKPSRFIDEAAGAATLIMATLGLSGANGPVMAVLATIVFGAAWTVHERYLLTTHRPHLLQAPFSEPAFAFFWGAAGLVLGILALLGVASALLTPIAAVIFGAGLIFMGGAGQGGKIPVQAIDSDLAGIRLAAGIAAVVLGTLAVDGNSNDLDLNLIALFLLGATTILTSGNCLTALRNIVRSCCVIGRSSDRQATKRPEGENGAD